MPEQDVNVLVVEDDPDAATYVSTVLRRKGGMSVTVAGDWQSALARFDEQEFDLLLTDIELPGLSGIHIVSEIRSRGLTLPVVVMTAHAQVDYAVEALRLGAGDFLLKPVDSDHLVERVRTLVAQARSAATSREPERVLAVGAHPDDVEIGAGGILASHHAAGDRISVLTLSGGAVGGEQVERRQEGQAAAAVVGGDLYVRDFQDTQIGPLAAVIRAVEEVIADVDPTVVYTHSAHDRHQDHRAVHDAVEVASRRVPTVACFESPSATIDFRPARFVPIDDFVDTKLRMLAAFASQSHRDYMQPDVVRATARYWSKFGVSAYAEPLEVIRASSAPGGPTSGRATVARDASRSDVVERNAG